MLSNRRVKKREDLVTLSIFKSLQCLFHHDLASHPTYARVKNECFRVSLLISRTYVYAVRVVSEINSQLKKKKRKSVIKGIVRPDWI